MPDVGEIEDALWSVAVGFEDTEEQVPVYIGGEVAKVWRRIDGGATGVDGNFWSRKRLKNFDLRVLVL